MTSDPSPIGTDHQIAMRDRHIARLTDQLRLARDYIAGHRPYATRAEVLAEINEALTEDPTPKDPR